MIILYCLNYSFNVYPILIQYIKTKLNIFFYIFFLVLALACELLGPIHRCGTRVTLTTKTACS